MCKKVHQKMKNDNLIILNPSIDDILEDNIYKLDLQEKSFYIPLWCNEVEFAVSEKEDIIIKCICELASHIDIDKYNNIIYHFNGKIAEVLREKSISIKLGKKSLQLPAAELLIKEHQVYVFKNQGMLRINNDDIYDTSSRGDIVVNLSLI